jgi:hypothetical protein
MHDDFRVRHFVEDQVGIRSCGQATNGWVNGPLAEKRMVDKLFDQRLDTPTNAACILRRTGLDVSGEALKVCKGWSGVAKLHRPYLAQMARTSSSVANSPRAAAACDAAIAARSSWVSGTGSA